LDEKKKNAFHPNRGPAQVCVKIHLDEGEFLLLWHTLSFPNTTKTSLCPFWLDGANYEIRYVPSESDNKISAVILTGKGLFGPYQFSHY